MLDYDNMLERVGGFGLYQKLMTACICVIYLPMGFFVFSSVFTHLTPEHRCRIPGIDEESESIFNAANLSDHIPLERDGVDVNLSRCSRYVTAGPLNYTVESNYTLSHTRRMEKCLDGWIYLHTVGRTSCVTELDLVCDNGWKKPLLTSALIFGLMLGSIVSGPMTDRFGRRPMCIATLFGSIVLLLLHSFVSRYVLLVLVIILIGVDHIILYCAAFVLAQELASKKSRATVACSINVTYAVGYTLLPLVAYLFTDWRWIIRSLGLFSLIYVPYFWFLPESPRWLIAKGDSKEAIKVLKRIAKFNNAGPIIVEDLEEDKASPSRLRSRLTDDNAENQLRVATSSVSGDITSLSKKREFQSSH